MELHVIHINPHGGVAVIGILYKYGHPDPFLAKVIKYVSFSFYGEFYFLRSLWENDIAKANAALNNCTQYACNLVIEFRQ